MFAPFSYWGNGTLQLFQPYKGGYIGYLYSSGDPGYNPNVQHGLIVAYDNLADAVWSVGTNTNIAGLGTGLGTGLANTDLIVTAVGAGTYAAKLCQDLSLNGYTDWFLPSFTELDKVADTSFTPSALPKIFLPTGTYWCSNQSNITPTTTAQTDTESSSGGESLKSTSLKVKPMRYF